MSDQELARAVRALRGFGSEAVQPQIAATTRQRSLAALARRRPQAERWAMAVALACLGGAALAQLGAWETLRQAAVGSAEKSEAESGTRSDTESEPEPEPESESESESEPEPEPEPESESEPEPEPEPESDSASASAAVRPKRASDSDRETALYRRAHMLHFGERVPGAALGAWAAYLRAYPRGVFAPEARCNRAIALVRLERLREARDALAPFACQREGAYRQSEARALVERIAARSADLPALRCPAQERAP